MSGRVCAAPAGLPAIAAFMDAYLENPDDAKLSLAFALEQGNAPLIHAECAGVAVALTLEDAAALSFIAMTAARAMELAREPHWLLTLAAGLDTALDKIVTMGAPRGKPN